MNSVIVHIRDKKIDNPKTIKRAFDELEDGRYLVEIKKSNKRTLAQNAWLHAILPDVLAGLRNMGYDAVRTTIDAKKVLKTMFFKKVVSNGVEDIPIIEDTSDTSKEDFIERTDAIIRWAQDYLGINIAPPNKQFEFFET